MAPFQCYLDCIAQLGHDPETQCLDDRRVYVRPLNEHYEPGPEIYLLEHRQLVFNIGDFTAEPPWEHTTLSGGLSRLTGPARIPLVTVLPLSGDRARVWFAIATGGFMETNVPLQSIADANSAPSIVG